MKNNENNFFKIFIWFIFSLIRLLWVFLLFCWWAVSIILVNSSREFFMSWIPLIISWILFIYIANFLSKKYKSKELNINRIFLLIFLAFITIFNISMVYYELISSIFYNFNRWDLFYYNIIFWIVFLYLFFKYLNNK